MIHLTNECAGSGQTRAASTAASAASEWTAVGADPGDLAAEEDSSGPGLAPGALVPVGVDVGTGTGASGFLLQKSPLQQHRYPEYCTIEPFEFGAGGSVAFPHPS